MPPKDAFKAIRAHCLSKSDAVEDYPWGDVVWKAGRKIFAIGADGSHRFTIKSSLDKQAALVMHPAVEVARYVGRFGWITIAVTNRETLALAKQLINDGYKSLRPSSMRRESSE